MSKDNNHLATVLGFLFLPVVVIYGGWILSIFWWWFFFCGFLFPVTTGNWFRYRWLDSIPRSSYWNCWNQANLWCSFKIRIDCPCIIP